MQEFPSVEPQNAKISTTVLLSIAGLDPSCGAGLTADLKVFAAHGAYGVCCPTAWTIQSTQGVRASTPADLAQVRATLDCLAEDLSFAGIKIGMLASAGVLRAVADWLRPMRSRNPVLPVVLDPVLRASSGAALLEPEALPLLREELLPLVSVVTPNLAEAAELTGLAVTDRASAEAAAQQLLRCGSPEALGVIVTGGHLAGGSPDDLVLGVGSAPLWVRGEWVRTRATHGTGCAYSSALAARLAAGDTLIAAATAAKAYVEQAMRAAYPVGRGRGPMHHLFVCDR